jgi:hypothetical protein
MSKEPCIQIPTKVFLNERDIPRFNAETLIRRWMMEEERNERAFINQETDLLVMARIVMNLYVETGHRQQNPMQFK